MIKRINEGILNALKRINLRAVGAVILGGCAGLSLTASILPSVMSAAGLLDSFSTRWALGEYAVYSVMVWGMGGWAARKTGSPSVGASILGAVGIASGLLLTGVALGTGTSFLLAGGISGGLYGAIGGMLIGRTLAGEKNSSNDRPESNPIEKNITADHGVSKKTESKGKANKKDGVRLFRFFQ